MLGEGEGEGEAVTADHVVYCHTHTGNVDHAVHEKIEEADTESILQGLPLHEHDPAQYYPPVFGALRHIGTVEVSKEATVEALKEMILTLPAVGGQREGS